MNENIEKYPLKVIFYKDQEMKYYSQLDMLCVLERALRRSQLPFYCTKGFNPHVKISFFSGLKLGLEGKIEVVLYFRNKITHQYLKEKLNPQLPQGFRMIEAGQK